jgi:type VI secretion system protein ImpK
MNIVDCFFEVFYYTFFLNSIEFSQLPYNKVLKQYKTLFSNSLNTAKKAGFSEKEWGEGFFPVCSLIDETVLCSDWDEKAKWQQSPLQFIFFNTTNAGYEFYSRLSKLTKTDKNIIEVYDYCLNLGFKGRYFHPSDSSKLNELKDSVCELIYGKNNRNFPEIFFPEAYSESIKGKENKFWKTFILCFYLITPLLLFTALFYIFDTAISNSLINIIK